MRSVSGILLTAALLASVAAPATARTASEVVVKAPIVVQQASEVSQTAARRVTVSGRGYGHGRGLGQFGSLGYAVDHGWSSARILDHYYGGTAADTIPDVPIGVELLALRNKSVVLTGTALAVDGTRVGTPAVLVERVSAGVLRVRTGPGCAGPWTVGATRTAGITVTSGDAVGVCELGQVRGYRGNLRLVEASKGLSVVNQLPIEQYLRGVVPRESPASWATAGGGRGAQALQAQSVAARSYALSATYSAYATTCDTTACQVYRGAWLRSQTSGATTSLEDARTDAAINATSGLVRRMPNGSVARTEFSSSTGGHTAGGTFPAVPDAGDATASNPNRSWSVGLTVADFTARLGVGPIDDIKVSRRNGLGADSGRVTQVTVVSGGRTTTLTGSQVRTRLGLKSDWFSLSGFVSTTTADAVTQALWRDLLGRAPSSSERQERVSQIVNGRPSEDVALEVARSQERAQSVVVGVYQRTLDRTPVESEIQGWIVQYRQQGSVPVLQSSILASDEAWSRSGRDSRLWVDRMYRTTLGRSAAEWERTFWAGQLPTQGRYGVALGIAGSTEAANKRLVAYYSSMLGRQPDRGAEVHVPRLLGRGDGDLLVPAAIVASPEYLQRATRRF